MPDLDNRTIVFLASVTYTMLALAMLVLSVSIKGQKGILYWTVGTCGYAVFSLMIFLRGQIPDFLSVIVGNAGVLASMCAVAYGIDVFLHRISRPKLYGLINVAGLIGLLWFHYATPDTSARVLIVTATWAAIWGDMSWRMLRDKPQPSEPAFLFVTWVALLMTAFSCLRLVLTAVDPVRDLFGAKGFTTFTLLFLPVSTVLMVFGLIILAGSRFSRDLEQERGRLFESNRQLQDALDNVKTLTGLLPICANCKKVRDDKGYWQQIEGYISSHSQAEFSHGICPDCAKKLYPEYADELLSKK